jgi:hypothetical protein
MRMFRFAATSPSEILLFVAASGDVVFENTAFLSLQIIAGKNGNDDQTLECRRQILLDHLGQLVGLAF